MLHFPQDGRSAQAPRRERQSGEIVNQTDYLGALLASDGCYLDKGLWNDLVDRLQVYGVTHLTGGSQISPYRGPQDVPLHILVADLARAPEPRLRDALIPLLLRHPEHAVVVHDVLATLPGTDPVWHELRARLLAVAALQRIWRYVLALYLPAQAPIALDSLISALGLPPVEEREGEALLAAAAGLLAGSFPIDWADAWEDAADHLLTELRLAALPRQDANA